jgi:hypothetical protein
VKKKSAIIYDYTEHKLLYFIKHANNPIIQENLMNAYDEYKNGDIKVHWVNGLPIFITNLKQLNK